MNHTIAIFATLAFLATVTNTLQSQTYPEPEEPARLVNDFTGILTIDEADALEIRLMTIFDSAAIHIVVVMVSDIGKSKISEYAAGLYKDWGLERIENSRGILLLIHASPPSGIRGAFIEPESSIKSLITEEIAANIIKKILIPNFRKGKRFTAINQTAEVLLSISKGEDSEAGYKQLKSEKDGPGLLTFVLIAISAVLLIRIFVISRRRKPGKKV
jgi:uncharacterized protein